VEQALILFGFVLFLTFQVRRPYAPWLWPLRLLLLYLILAMGPSRIMEGEHWPSDVLGGLIYGFLWLLLGIHAYQWASRRWPRLCGHSTSHVV
jgi:membrane-associated phospholipid phosphatase